MQNRRHFLIAAGVAAGGTALATQAQPQPQSNAPSQTQTPPPAAPDHTVFILSPSADPYELFAQWLEEAKAAKENIPIAMTLATVDSTGMPDARMMLHKEIRDGRFLFVTHIDTPKGEQLKADPKAALVFFWKTLNRQVRVRGRIQQLSEAEADAAWQHRGPRTYKLNDWAWPQSQVFVTAEDLEQRKHAMDARFKDDPPRPPAWSGYLLTPLSIEFFYSHPTLLHERLRFTRTNDKEPWQAQRLVP